MPITVDGIEQADLGGHLESNGVVDVATERGFVVRKLNAKCNHSLSEIVEIVPSPGGHPLVIDTTQFIFVITKPVVIASGKQSVRSG